MSSVNLTGHDKTIEEALPASWKNDRSAAQDARLTHHSTMPMSLARRSGSARSGSDSPS